MQEPTLPASLNAAAERFGVTLTLGYIAPGTAIVTAPPLDLAALLDWVREGFVPGWTVDEPVGQWAEDPGFWSARLSPF